jgi:hypothetical protein
MREYMRTWRANNREKQNEQHRAQMAVLRAIKKGLLVRPDVCERCGSGGEIEAHHEDYSKPLLVEWLCLICHRSTR